MNPVKVRNVCIGEGMPKICVPIVGVTKEEIFKEAGTFHEIPLDVVEWRADWFEGVCSDDQVREVLVGLRERLGEVPLLFTFRTAAEGGEKEIDAVSYFHINQLAIESGAVDLVDVEAFRGDELVTKIIAFAHGHGVKVVGSNHDFHKTPPKEELLYRLKKMQSQGADIPKLAVMPQNKQDVLTLLAATEEMSRLYADRPIITMSMAADGVISRLCGEVFGSALTFGAAQKASAPGQMGVKELSNVLRALHNSL